MTQPTVVVVVVIVVVVVVVVVVVDVRRLYLSCDNVSISKY